MLLNITLFDVRFWGVEYREEMILKVTVYDVSVCGVQY
jgi:hypothetical protein